MLLGQPGHRRRLRRRTVLAAQTMRTGRREAHLYMKATTKVSPEQEPIGIVISRGNRDEATPVFWAYVWGPAPEPTDKTLQSQPI